jgi:hypothetical protein
MMETSTTSLHALQVPIIIGENGAAIKKLGQLARKVGGCRLTW